MVSGALIRKSQHAVRLLGAALLSAALAVGLVNWSGTRDRWVLEAPPGTGPRAARLSLAADGPIQGWLESATPRLDIRCSPSAGIEFEVTTGLAAAVEPGNQRTVRYWFDEDEDTLTTWTQSADRRVLSAPTDAVAGLVASLATAERFHFAYIPFNAEPARATFNLTGFANRWNDTLAVCRNPGGQREGQKHERPVPP